MQGAALRGAESSTSVCHLWAVPQCKYGPLRGEQRYPLPCPVTQMTHRCGLVMGSTRCSGSFRHADVALVVQKVPALIVYGLASGRTDRSACIEVPSTGALHPPWRCHQAFPLCCSSNFSYCRRRAGRIACRVIRTVLAFHHRATVQVVPVVGRLSGLSARRSPVEAMRSVVCCADC